jgi:hypothetical protein
MEHVHKETAMLKKLTLTGLFIFIAVACLAQEPPPDLEEACKAAGDYWSESLSQCFLRAEMDSDQALIFKQIQSQQASKDQLQHEQQEYNASNKAARAARLDARIAELEARRDAADAEVKLTYESEIGKVQNQKKFSDEFDISNHGQQISALSSSIGKHKEELDGLLTQ